MGRCTGCSRASFATGVCFGIAGTIFVSAFVYMTEFMSPDFAVEGEKNFSLNLTQEMTELGCSFLLLREQQPDVTECSTRDLNLETRITAPGGEGWGFIIDLLGGLYAPINGTACTYKPLPWMRSHEPRLEFVGRLMPIVTSLTDATPRTGEYVGESDVAIWAVNECDHPYYLHFPETLEDMGQIVVLVAGGVGVLSVVFCFFALLVYCCETAAPASPAREEKRDARELGNPV